MPTNFTILKEKTVLMEFNNIKLYILLTVLLEYLDG